MTLEDHLGDIIRKARCAAKVSEAGAAQVAKMSAAEFRTLEQTGRIDKPLDFTALAPLIGLNGEKLATLAKGWRPVERDLGRWPELRIVTTTKNEITVHCYLIWDEVSREAALFDTGWDAKPVLKLLADNELILRHLFLTHTHEDHIAGMEAVRAVFPKIHLHTNSKNAPHQHRNRANDFIHLGSLRITNRDTPGHAEDGVTYVIGNWPEDAPHVALTGDTIFAGSLATGLQSLDLLKEQVRKQIFSLPGETLLGPGHGPLTTVEEEKAHNPFF